MRINNMHRRIFNWYWPPSNLSMSVCLFFVTGIVNNVRLFQHKQARKLARVPCGGGIQSGCVFGGRAGAVLKSHHLIEIPQSMCNQENRQFPGRKRHTKQSYSWLSEGWGCSPGDARSQPLATANSTLWSLVGNLLIRVLDTKISEECMTSMALIYLIWQTIIIWAWKGLFGLFLFNICLEI